MSDQYNAEVVQRIDVAPGLMILRVASDGELFPFTAGQYTVLGLCHGEPRVFGSDPDEESNPEDKLVRRAYSIASSSLDREFLELYVTLVRSGELTPRLFSLQIGSRLFLGPKATGVFTLDRVPVEKSVLMIATGTGLAPYVSILRTELARAGCARELTIVHGARYSWDLAYRDELTTLDRLCPSFHYLAAITRPETDHHWSGPTGRLQDLMISGRVEGWLGKVITPEEFDVFLCGHPGMIADMQAMLEARGFAKDSKKAPGNLHTEEYW